DLQPSAAPNTVYRDAASLPGMSKITKTTSNPTVSKGKFIELNDTSKENTIEAAFNMKKPGNYYLLIRMAITENLKPRKFQLALDDNPEKTIEYQPVYRWSEADDNGFKVLFLQELGDGLSEGEHHISLKNIDGKINLNQLIITD